MSTFRGTRSPIQNFEKALLGGASGEVPAKSG
jgi:hypothetical protein